MDLTFNVFGFCSRSLHQSPSCLHHLPQLTVRMSKYNRPFWGLASTLPFFGNRLFLTGYQYVTLRKRKDDWESVTTSHPDYIRFYNSLWLVANDVIIGIALGSYIIDNSAWVAEFISEILSLYSIASLHSTIVWLMDWPAGLKLNNELAAFLGDLFLWVIDHWSSTYSSQIRRNFN